jgi:outer membrane lipoprotein-sorting protein
MKRKVLVCGLAMAMALLGTAGLAEEGSDLSLDEVIARNTEAKGGEEKIRQVDTVKATGKMGMGPGMEAPFTWTWKRPDKLRMSFEMQGMTGTQAFDGESGWMVMPFMGQSEPEKMTEEQLDQFKNQTDWEGPLMDYEEKGHKVELIGKEETEGTEAYKIRVTYENGNETYLFLDAEYFLEIKQVAKREIQGNEIEVEMSIGDYKEVDGLMVAHSITIKPMGAPAGQTLTFETLEFNGEVDDSVFEMPEPEAKEEAPESSE